MIPSTLLSAQTEEGVKAAALQHLLSFVRWPADGREEGDLIIAVLGRGLESGLAILDGRSVNGRRVSVRRFSALASVGQPHILFISAGESDGYARAFEFARSRSILTVGETSDFVEAGGAVSVCVPNGNLAIFVSRGALRDAGLTASSLLMRLADEPCDRNGGL